MPAEARATTAGTTRLPATERVKVNEIFYSLQGESTLVGRPCVLVRLTGCQMRCTWCDSEHSFFEGSWMSLEAVLEEVARYCCPLVEVTGGEPLLQPGARPLLARLADSGYEVMLETGGGLEISGIDARVRRIVDIKCPASGESDRNHWQNLDLLTPRDELKLVIADEADYLWARSMIAAKNLAGRCPVHLSPVTGRLEPAMLAGWILRDRLPVRLSLQLHKILWGPHTRAV